MLVGPEATRDLSRLVVKEEEVAAGCYRHRKERHGPRQGTAMSGEARNEATGGRLLVMG